MDNSNFDWDRGNIAHIAKHDVAADEAEHVVPSDPLEVHFDPDIGGEERWTYLGETNSGRILNVVITIRDDRIRVVTAYEAERSDKLLYLKTKAEQS
jgi:uncharacterized protein